MAMPLVVVICQSGLIADRSRSTIPLVGQPSRKTRPPNQERVRKCPCCPSIGSLAASGTVSLSGKPVPRHPSLACHSPELPHRRHCTLRDGEPRHETRWLKLRIPSSGIPRLVECKHQGRVIHPQQSAAFPRRAAQTGVPTQSIRPLRHGGEDLSGNGLVLAA